MTNTKSPTSSQKVGKNIFVTVGTTRFDKLVSSVTTKIALEWMETQGYTSLTIQYGRGEKPDTTQHSTSIKIQSYDFRPSLKTDMEQADLILSHAGAGTIMEVLRMKKKMIVVINTDLMDNHQTELAGAMADRGHLHVVDSPIKLNDKKTWAAFQDFSPIPHQGGDAFDMPRLLDLFFGFASVKTE